MKRRDKAEQTREGSSEKIKRAIESFALIEHN